MPTNKIIEVKVKKLHPKASMPVKAFSEDAGWDLCALKEVIIPSQSERIIPTGLAMAIPKGYFGLIKVRSGTSIHDHITESAGVIDSSYRNEVGIVMVNYTYAPITITAGMKIAQLLILPVPEVQMTDIGSNNLDVTERKGGFGSTN